MKKFILALIALFTITVSASAMSYEQARQQALFLTDKMAYELNLTDEQYEAAYEVNLDYLMSINDCDDIYGSYWNQRNMDLSYILLDWQYRTFCSVNYFYNPIYYDGGYWHFRIYARYPHRDYYYFGRPDFYAVYRGGHSWRVNGGRSWYNGQSFSMREGKRYVGMRDSFNNGSFNNNRTFGGNNNNRIFGGSRNDRAYNGNNGYNGNSVFGNGNDNDNTPKRVFGSRPSSTRTTAPNGSSVFGGSRSGNNLATPNRTFERSDNNNNNRSAGSSNVPSRSFNSGNSNRSFGGGNSTPSRSFGGGNSSNTKSESHGGVFGGHR
ncbi:hypothetical protein [Segatella paludivivens]|uniref:hypothetical protein n=1 Tax=Segatella paludivivens TaxID=185294 RepID=UPI00039C8D61|nr:hypothetical protein [Segatella paludivivens]